jgi:hypothetical protein
MENHLTTGELGLALKKIRGLYRLAQAPEWCKSVWPSIKKGQATLVLFKGD